MNGNNTFNLMRFLTIYAMIIALVVVFFFNGWDLALSAEYVKFTAAKWLCIGYGMRHVVMYFDRRQY